MKFKPLKVFVVAAASILLMTPTLTDADAAEGFYIGLDVGYSTLHDSDIDGDISGTTKDNGTVTVDDTYLLSAAVGFASSGPFRAELQGSYQKFDVDTIKENRGTVEQNGTGEAELRTITLNALIDLGDGSGAVTPYVGIGGGAAYVELDNISRPGRSAVNEDGFAAVGQLMAGLDYPVNDVVSLMVGYRLQWIPNADGSHTRSNGTTVSADADDIVIHNATVGLRFSF